jgi:hypothetical protein
MFKSSVALSLAKTVESVLKTDRQKKKEHSFGERIRHEKVE